MKYGNFSYADVMLYPLASALAQAADANTKIYLAMQVRAPALEIFSNYVCSLKLCMWHV